MILARAKVPEIITGNGYRAVHLKTERKKSAFLRVFMENGGVATIHEKDGLVLKGGLYRAGDDLELGDRVRMTVANIQNYYGWRHRDYRKAEKKSAEAEQVARTHGTPILEEDLSYLPERGVGFKRGFLVGLLEASYTSKDHGWLRVNLREDKSADSLYTVLAEFGVIAEIERQGDTMKPYSRLFLSIDGILKNVEPDGVSERNELNGTSKIVDIEPFEGTFYKFQSNLDSVVFNNTFHHIISNDE